MLDEFVGQVKRLFSSKTNSARLVYSVTDRLHFFKLILIAISVILLLGYGQFRPHFHCHAHNRIPKETLTQFCWVNGTSTINMKESARISKIRANSSHHADTYMPHIGVMFKLKGDDKYEVVNHNYMRSLWGLLLLLAVFSLVALRVWSSIFRSDTMKALLNLPGSEDLPLVKKAIEKRPLERLMKLGKSREIFEYEHQVTPKQQPGDQLASQPFVQEAELLEDLLSITGDENEHNQALNYYPNQLIYLLLAKRISAYQLPQLKLRRRLIIHSICSFLLTLMQFILPLISIGREYYLYGINYLKAWLSYTIYSLASSGQINSIDYDISSRIWPTSTTCRYRQFGYVGIDEISVQCTVAINEICAKLFFFIWWVVVINILIELYHTSSILICSLNSAIVRKTFTYRFWPQAREEMRQISNFRIRHALLQARLAAIELQRNNGSDTDTTPSVSPEQLSKSEEAARDRCSRAPPATGWWRLNLTQQNTMDLSSETSYGELSCWSSWFSRGSNHSPKDVDFLKDSEGFCESREDVHLYYLFYLLYLRLGCSRRKVQCVIKSTNEALNRYLELFNSQRAARK